MLLIPHFNKQPMGLSLIVPFCSFFPHQREGFVAPSAVGGAGKVNLGEALASSIPLPSLPAAAGDPTPGYPVPPKSGADGKPVAVAADAWVVCATFFDKQAQHISELAKGRCGKEGLDQWLIHTADLAAMFLSLACLSLQAQQHWIDDKARVWYEVERTDGPDCVAAQDSNSSHLIPDPNQLAVGRGPNVHWFWMYTFRRTVREAIQLAKDGYFRGLDALQFAKVEEWFLQTLNLVDTHTQWAMGAGRARAYWEQRKEDWSRSTSDHQRRH
ncbi:hypothetical protein VaNZ11_009049 [Volvox africanus]|uniref:Uncharacterized protein n=1 Tax=Volvox africanus TaxID=51714 RepID=A0ABQ5S788_9CHLO|nr:hypothetical protein VaNZ11_009049 [Volvox africanus]